MDTAPCPSCGSPRPDDAPRGLCPRCLLMGGLNSEALSLSRAGELGATVDLSGSPSVLESLSASVGTVPRVLLRDTDVATEPPVHHAGSAEMPAPDDRPSRLRLLGEIARGGMGAVLKGRDEDLGRELAVKVLLDRHRDDPDLVRRFVEEAQIGGQLQHPGIVPVYELGAFADRRPYFAMKLVKGQTLAALLAARTSPSDGLPRFLGIFEHVAQTVAYAHARGVIHRDLKPSNVMVGGFGEVQVMDWGLAKVLIRGGAADDASAGKVPEQETVIATARSGGDSDVDLSRAGSVMGTPSYMAPEQARGEVEAIDERADVFALGSILCELLTGAPAFTGRSVGEIQRRAARGDTADALARLDASAADADLIALARACLAAEPADRPRDAGAVSARVTSHLAGVQERLQTAERERAVAEARADGERRKRRWQLGLVASVAASLLLGGLGLAAFTATLNRQKDALAQANADLLRQRRRAEANEAAAIDAVKRFRDAVAENPELKDNPELEPLRKALLKEPLAYFRALRDRLQAGGEARPEALARLADASFELARLTAEIGDERDALSSHREALALRERLAEAHPDVPAYQSDLARSHNSLGTLRAGTGDQAGARADLEAALTIRRRLADAHPAREYRSDLARTYNDLGIVLRKAGDPAGSRAAHEAALTLRKRLADAHPAVADYLHELAMSHGNLGIAFAEAGQPAKSLTSFQAARAIYRRLADARPDIDEYQSSLATWHMNLGTQLSLTGRPAEARAEFEAARTIWRRLADAHPAVTKHQSGLASSHLSIGLELARLGRSAEARAEYEAALARYRRLADAHPDVLNYQDGLAMAYTNLGNLSRETGHPDEARAPYEAALAIRRRQADTHPEAPSTASNLGAALSNRATLDLVAARYAPAIDRLREAIAWQRKALAVYPRHPVYREFLRNHYLNLHAAAVDLGDAGLEAEARRALAELEAGDPRLDALDARLVAVRRGEPPRDDAERLALAQRAYDTRRYAEAARLMAEALESDPKLGDDREAQHRYNAACAAALAASGRGEDDPKPDDAAKATLRRQALGWLQAERDAWAKALDPGDPKARAAVAETLRHWQQDADLAGVRDEAELARLPEAERAAWKALWEDVRRIAEKARPAS